MNSGGERIFAALKRADTGKSGKNMLALQKLSHLHNVFACFPGESKSFVHGFPTVACSSVPGRDFPDAERAGKRSRLAF